MIINPTNGRKTAQPGLVSVASGHLSGHIVLCGLEGLGLRTLEELHELGEDVVIIANSPSETFVQRAEEIGATVIQGNQWEESVLSDAGIINARAIILTDKDDVHNLHAGLAAQDLNPGIPIIMHMFNTDLGQQVKALFQNCAVLSSRSEEHTSELQSRLHLVCRLL